MSACPVCNAPVTVDFGLAQCEQCGAHLIVHADGQVEYSGSHAEEDAEPSPILKVSEQPEAEGETPAEMPIDVLVQPELLEVHESLEAVAQEVPQEEATEPENPPMEDLFQDNPPDENVEAPAVYSPPVTSSSPDLSDIAQFGNSDSLSRDGSLRYNLFVTGIDTADVREAFREAMTDRKFVWDTDEILRSIHHGEVKITNVTAVKASILISRLRNLPLKIKWEQYAVHQA